TDKTGTLTENRLRVASVRTLAAGEGDAEDDPAGRRRVLEHALRAEEDAWPREGVVPGSFTRALATAVEADGGATTLHPAALIDLAPPAEAEPSTPAPA